MSTIVDDPPIYLGEMVALAIAALIVLWLVVSFLFPYLGLRPCGETPTPTETPIRPTVYVVEPPENIGVRARVLDHEVRVYVHNTGNETVRLRVYAVLRNPFTGLETLSSAVVDELEPGVERAVSLKKTPLDTVVVVVVLRD